MERILVVDTRLLAYMTFHRHEDIYQTFEYIHNYGGEFSPYDKIVFAFDSIKGSLRRKAMYKEYKAHRRDREKKQTQREQDRLKKFNRDYKELYTLFSYLGNPILLSGWEADDIANIIVDRKKPNQEIYLLSSDSDWSMNLVDDKVYQIHLTKGLIDRETCKYILGKSPEENLFIQSLCGITKENVKGVYRFGETKCKKLLLEYNENEILNMVQEWVDTGKYGCKLPDGYSSVKELYEFNRELLRPITYNDLGVEEKENFNNQLNREVVTDLEELDYQSITRFEKPLMLSIEAMMFYNLV